MSTLCGGLSGGDSNVPTAIPIIGRAKGDLLHGDSKRRGFIFHKVEGYQLDAVNVPTGKHDVRVGIQSATESYDETTTMAEATIGTNDSILRVICDKKSGRLAVRME